MRRHPTKHDLLQYAESLVDKQVTVSAALAAHVTRCPKCTRRAQAMRETFAVTAAASEIQPSAVFTQDLLRAARQERIRQQAPRARAGLFFSLAKGLAYAATILVVGAFCFQLALDYSHAPVAQPQNPVALSVAATQAPSPESIRKTTDHIETLASAVSKPSTTSTSLIEHEQFRAAQALSHDVAAAYAALQRNPGSARAHRILHTNLQRQVQTLRDLYVAKSL